MVKEGGGLQQTALYQQHLAANAKLVDFSGWEMPLHYGSQVQEHHQVREDAGVFDVSHMNPVHIKGAGARQFLHYLLANNVDKLKQPGKALYSCMLNADGGVIDDLLVYYIAENNYLLVLNAGTRDKDIAWLQQQVTDFEVDITPYNDCALLAIQGPNAIAKLSSLGNEKLTETLTHLKLFSGAYVDDWFVARTGYTGEDGVEIILPANQADAFWQQLLAADIKPCGLGARDTLRLEAAMNLYGTDMDETTTPLESGLSWTVAWEPATREFIGRAKLEAQREQGTSRKFIGLVLTGRGMLRNHQAVFANGEQVGEITSGSFAPTLGHAVALARVNTDASGPFSIDNRGKMLPVTQVKPPFVRNGKQVFECI